MAYASLEEMIMSDETTNDAKIDAYNVVNLKTSGSVPFELQKDVHSARTTFTDPKDYNAYMTSLESNFQGSDPKNQQLLNTVQFYGAKALDPQDIQTIYKGGAESDAALSRLGFNNVTEFKNLYGTAVDSTGNVVVDPKNSTFDDGKGNVVTYYADSSSKGVHFETDASGNKHEVAVNITDKDGTSSRLALQSGEWKQGTVAPSWGLAGSVDQNSKAITGDPATATTIGVQPAATADSSVKPTGVQPSQDTVVVKPHFVEPSPDAVVKPHIVQPSQDAVVKPVAATAPATQVGDALSNTYKISNGYRFGANGNFEITRHDDGGIWLYSKKDNEYNELDPKSLAVNETSGEITFTPKALANQPLIKPPVISSFQLGLH